MSTVTPEHNAGRRRAGQRPAGQRPATMPALVGRTAELAELAEALAGPPSVAIVEGEAGIGKSRLVAELQTHPDLDDHRFVVGWCQRIREPFPLGPMIEAVRMLARDLPGRRLSPVTGALRPLLPEITDVLPPSPDPLEDRAAERHRVFRALVEIFTAVSPAVLVVEDAHWADEHTIDFLRYLLNDLPPDLSLLLTYRGEEVEPSLRGVTATLPPAVRKVHVQLAPMDATQAGALAAAILSQDRISDEFAAYLCERASGLPFVIEELVALLQARGTLVRRGAGWVRRALDQLDVPTGIRDPVRERFSRLGDHARAVAEAAAVLQVPVPVAVLVATTRLPEQQATDGVEAALESGLLVEHEAGVGFRHVLAAQAVYDAIPRMRRSELHTRAATALELRDPVSLGQRAHHLRHAGRIEEWVEAADQAADQAIRLGHDDEAARLLEDVLRDAPLSVQQRGRVAVKLARTAHQVLHFNEDVVDLLFRVLDAELPRGMRGELRLRLALLLERTGAQFDIQRPLIADAVADLDDQPVLLAHAMAALGIPCVPGIPLAEHEKWLRRVLDIVPAIEAPALKVSLLGKVAMVQVAVGDPAWRGLVDRIVDQAPTPSHESEASAFHSVGANALYAGHLDVADRLLTAARPGTRSDETTWRELSTEATLALLDYCLGDWDDLAERADELVDQLAGHAPGRADVEVVAGSLALAHGELERAARTMDDVAQRLTQRGAFDLLPLAASTTVRLAVDRGDVVTAADATRRFLSAVESVPLVVSVAWALPALTAALAAEGSFDEVHELLARWDGHLGELDAPLAAAAFPRARGVLAAATGDPLTASDHLLVAAGEYSRLGLAYEEAQTREQAGSSLVLAGREDVGAAELQAALELFQRLGASWDLDRCSGVAREHGVSVPARHRGGRRGYGTALSPRERNVAELVSQGRTNNEIAAELFVSVKTIERHVSAVMRKLGVTSRRSIAGQLVSLDDDVAGH
ncbi:MAG TPA: AAA family ATPase [Jiangellaceae bacterium]